MSISSLRDNVSAAFGRLFDALADQRRGERTVVAVLALYAGVWTLYGVIAKGSQDIHVDMGEQIAWSRDLALGYLKHPPLAAVVVKLWFELFPVADWSYYLLAMLVAALALWIAWRLSADYLDAEKRVVALALLTLIPFFNFHALKFNVNTVLMPLWAMTTLWFLRSFATRSASYAALAGIAAAACVLGKYWSIFLLIGLGLAAVLDPRRGAYFRSAAPWITIVAGLLALSPHIGWLIEHGFAPFGYAMAVHGDKPFATAALAALGYLGGALGYVAVAVVLAVLAARPSRAAFADLAWPASLDRRLVAVAFWAPLLIPAVVATASGIEITSLWSMPMWALMPVVLLSSPRVTVPRAAAIRILATAVVAPLLFLAAAPVVAIVVHRQGLPNFATHYRLVAQAVERTWRETTDRPLRLIGSYNNLLYGTVFYFADRPSTLDVVSPYLMPWTDEARIARDGIALFCPANENPCLTALNERAARAPAARRAEVDIARTYFGVADQPMRYVIVTIPPRR